MWRAVWALLLWAALHPAAAQTLDPDAYPVFRTDLPFLVLEQDRLLAESELGQAIRAENEAAADSLRREGQQLDRQFEEEERQLTEQRATLSPEEFRVLADAFDEKVVATRAAQEERAAALTREADARQRDFFRRVGPILLGILEETGASAVIEQRALLVTKQDLNITREVIKRLDAAYRAGQATGGAPPTAQDPQLEPFAD
ncbi:MAG: OmpH family outer membrane protein [Pseudomonadota bacterium]